MAWLPGSQKMLTVSAIWRRARSGREPQLGRFLMRGYTPFLHQRFALRFAMMSFPFSRLLLAAALCCPLAACSGMKRKPIPKAAPIRFPKTNTSDGTKGKPKPVGTILLVNAEAGFVLIDAHGRALPDAGTALKCIRDGADSGILAVGGERQGAHVIADIVTGTPRKGDQVFQ